jgi:hypothetical protein
MARASLLVLVLRQMARASLLVLLFLLLLGSARAQAAVYFRSTASAQTGSGASSVTVNLPTGTVAGDVMIATVNVEGGTGLTAPAGWSSTGLYAGPSVFGYSGVYYKVATATEPGSYTWSLGSSLKAIGAINSYVGVDNTAPIETSAVNGAGSGTGASTASVTTTAANSMVMLGADADATSSFTITAPAGTTSRGQVFTSGGGTVVGGETADFVQASAGATGTKTFTLSASTPWGTIAIGLKPGTGALAFSNVPKTPVLPTVTLNGMAQTANATMNSFGVDDTTGGGSGWNVTVAGDTTAGKSPVFKRYCPNPTCGSDTGPGYVAGGASLAAGSLKLNTTGATWSTNGGSGAAPAFQCSAGCSVDAGSATKIVSAAAAGGLGPWSTSGFGATSLALSSPTTTRVLPASEIYHVDLVWTLNSGP